eukprot:4174745-Pyramimonas_sp.AAC.1
MATKAVSDMFISLLDALAYALMTQVWSMVRVASLQREQRPTNLQVPALTAVARELQRGPKKIRYQLMAPAGEVGLYSGPGY